MALTIRPVMRANIAAIFVIRTSVTENHHSREHIRERGIIKEAVNERGAQPHCLGCGG